MNNYLGIDLGTNSIGWAIRNPSVKGQQISKSGVLRFDKGVGEEKGNEFPKVKKRTESRGRRRNYQSEKYRKFELLEFLIERGMCPLKREELNSWKHYTKGERRKYPQSEEFINWLRFDFDGDGKPDFEIFGLDKHESHYIFRVFAVSEKEEHINVYKKNPHILGRVLYHLVQRRGFRGKDSEEAETIIKGSSNLGIPGRESIESYIEKHNTLGAALYYYQKENGGRIRARYNLRKDYEYELKEICRIQEVSDEEYKKLWKSIIWQRPLRTQKGLVGLCTFEKRKRRVAVSHPLYQEYKTWVLINNLKINPPEGIDKSNYLKESIYPLFIRKTDFEIKHIVKEVLKSSGKMESKFTSSKEQKTKVVALSDFYEFKEVLGDGWKEKYKFDDIYRRPSQPLKKDEIEGYTIEDIWHVLNTFDSAESLKTFALEKLGLDENKSERFSKIKLKKGYATLSLSAVKKILPYLRKGYLYSHAVYLANLPKVLGVTEVSEELVSAFIDEIEPIKSRVEEIKSLTYVVNALITEHLNENNRYFIENDRELDASETFKIEEKLRIEFGERKWNSLEDSTRNSLKEYVAEKFKYFLKRGITDTADIFLKSPRLHEEIFKTLQERYDIPDENIKYLWHPSEQEKYPNSEEFFEFELGNDKRYVTDSKIESFIKKYPNYEKTARSLRLLGSPEPISKGFKNPMALKTLYRLKWLINYLLQTDQIDEYTKIVVEIARDGQLNDANKRIAIRRWQQKREKENEGYKKKIEEINKECKTSFSTEDKDLIIKLRLWDEQGKQCIYTGETINYCDVFDGSKFDFEHTIPQKLSFDNELKNLTLANKGYNMKIKKKQIPFQLKNYNEDAMIDGVKYPSIEPRLKFMIDKIDQLESLIKENIRKVKYVSTKEVKDVMIQNRHILKLDLNYWKAKYQTFTCEEYKQGWRNSQLRDTQTITKYALPYLRTVFKRVDVQTGLTVDKFKEIYGVKFSVEKKDRENHPHHAVDAAILTLIPNSYHREKMLEMYHEAKANKSKYHDNPRDWEDFESHFILEIKDNVLANYLTDSRTLEQTYKNVRKRGRIQYNTKTKKPLVARGETIRGQLHTESFYGAIKQPKRDSERKILFDESGKMILEDEVKMVIRRSLEYKKDADSNGFKTLQDLKKVIVDLDLFEEIKKQVGSKTFKDALEEGVWRLNKHGDKVNRIRRIRCWATSGRGFLKHSTALPIHTHSFSSRKEYKKMTYSVTEENVFCLFYEKKIDDEYVREFKLISTFKVANLGFSSEKCFFNEPYYNRLEVRNGGKNFELPLAAIIKKGTRVIAYEDNIEELKDIESPEIYSLLYNVQNFNLMGTPYIYLRHHLEARKDSEIEEPTLTSVNNSEKPKKYKLKARKFNFAIEGKDFEIMIDGQIRWKF